VSIPATKAVLDINSSQVNITPNFTNYKSFEYNNSHGKIVVGDISENANVSADVWDYSRNTDYYLEYSN
jgi:hypothetical protein